MSEGLDATCWGTLMPRTLKWVAGLQFDCTELSSESWQIVSTQQDRTQAEMYE